MVTSSFYASLKQQTIEAIANGRSRFLIWGFNPDCIRLVQELAGIGFREHVVGIVVDGVDDAASRPFPIALIPRSRVRELAFDALVIAVDDEKEDALRAMAELLTHLPQVIIAGSGHFAFRDKLFAELLSTNPVKSKAWGYPSMLIHIYQCVRSLLDYGMRGSIVEFGAYNCGTTIFLARLLRRLGYSERIIALDTFGPYPPRRHVLDLFRSAKCECFDSATVDFHAREYGIELIKGDISETYTQLRGIPMLLCFFDTDNYSPTRAALELCYAQTVCGGVLAFDHYFSEDWVDTIGERLAADEVLTGKGMLHLHGTGIFLKR